MYVCALPFFLLDLTVCFYQWTCFPVYGIPKVRRSEYLIFDRGRLPYLNVVEKAGCVYCSYANGLLAYIGEIVARTEQHFCPSGRPLARPRYASALFALSALRRCQGLRKARHLQSPSRFPRHQTRAEERQEKRVVKRGNGGSPRPRRPCRSPRPHLRPTHCREGRPRPRTSCSLRAARPHSQPAFHH